jgi:bifunctional enzyme CysN/CysC
MEIGTEIRMGTSSQELEVSRNVRAPDVYQQPCCIWFTGLSGSGKSTIAYLLEKRLRAQGLRTCVLDGDKVRRGLNRDLGFTDDDQAEHIRRVAEVAKLMVDAGLIVLVSLISPFRSERRRARGLFAVGEFVEVFVDAPLAECERRDIKGLYAQARRGQLQNFTGIGSDYHPPENPEIHLETGKNTSENCAASVCEFLDKRAINLLMK